MENRSITIAQQSFVDALLDGHSVSDSARLAGYAPENSPKLMRGIAVNRKLTAHARDILRGRIDLEGAPAGYKVLMHLLHLETTPLSVRVDIAKFLVNHSVPAPKAKDETPGDDKEPSDMSTAELREYLVKLNTESAKRGELIDATPIQAIEDII